MKQEDITKLAEANINMQMDLRKTMVHNLSRMLYLIRDEVKKVFTIVDGKKKLNDSIKQDDKESIYATLEFTKPEWDSFYFALREIREGGYFEKLGNSRMFKEAEYDHDIAKEMLKKLES